jgi:alpha-tubulin suppressor-like RCC1 family protein
VQVSAGYNDTCVRKVDGTAWCWGFDGIGELGDGTTNDSSIPVAAITVGGGVAEVSTGEFHTCARKTDGTLWCWGYDADGELGDGTTNGSFPPEQVSTNVAQVSTGYLHTCAVKSDGSVWCWGQNGSGQLGDGTTTTRTSPVPVMGLGGPVTQVSAGDDHTCALKSDGTVWCWGGNVLGQLGDGTTSGRATPAAVPALGSAVVEVSANDQFACARKTDGTLWCWGGNTDGELGNGTLNNATTPVQVTALGNSVAEVSAGDNGGCALKTDGSLWCWGSNFHGNVGDGTTTRRLSPVPVTTLGNSVVEVSCGVHTCARKTDGTVWCWGFNSNGQLGDGTTTDNSTPVKVPILTMPVGIAAPAGTWRTATLLALLLVASAWWTGAWRGRLPGNGA